MAVVGQASLIQSCAPHPSRRHSGMVSVLCVRVVARCLLHVSCVSIWVSRELAGVDSLCGGSAICVMHREIRANIAQYSKIFRALRARQMSRSISRYVATPQLATRLLGLLDRDIKNVRLHRPVVLHRNVELHRFNQLRIGREVHRFRVLLRARAAALRLRCAAHRRPLRAHRSRRCLLPPVLAPLFCKMPKTHQNTRVAPTPHSKPHHSIFLFTVVCTPKMFRIRLRCVGIDSLHFGAHETAIYLP